VDDRLPFLTVPRFRLPTRVAPLLGKAVRDHDEFPLLDSLVSPEYVPSSSSSSGYREHLEDIVVRRRKNKKLPTYKSVSFSFEVEEVWAESGSGLVSVFDYNLEVGSFNPEDSTITTWEYLTHFTISRDQTAGSNFQSLLLIALSSKGQTGDTGLLKVRILR
jgi:hypothetical protein